MPYRDLSTVRDLIHYRYATIIAKSAFAASDGESSLKHRDDKKFYDAIPPVRSGTLDKGDLDGDDVATVLDVDAVIR
jgi:hypothetical protein